MRQPIHTYQAMLYIHILIKKCYIYMYTSRNAPMLYVGKETAYTYMSRNFPTHTYQKMLRDSLYIHIEKCYIYILIKKCAHALCR